MGNHFKSRAASNTESIISFKLVLVTLEIKPALKTVYLKKVTWASNADMYCYEMETELIILTRKLSIIEKLKKLIKFIFS